MSPIGFTSIGGYLGAGKTTLVNQLLATTSGRRYAVLVNDFGEVNIDAAMIASHDGDTIALENGCVCCSLAQGFAVALDTIRDRTPPIDHVVVEVSGVGDPWKSAQWGHSPGFELRAVVTVADLDQLVRQLGDKYVGETIRNQLTNADLVIGTKQELAGDRAHDALRVIATATNAPVFLAPFDLDVLLEPEVPTSHTPSGPPSEEPNHPDHEAFVVDVRQHSAETVSQWLASAPAAVIRAKGIVGDTVMQLVGKRFEATPVSAELAAAHLQGDLVVLLRPGSDPSNVAEWRNALGTSA